MLGVPAYTHERRSYSATLYPTSFTLNSLPTLTIRAQRKTNGWSFLWFVWDSSCDCMFWDNRGGGLTGQPVGQAVGTATMTAVMSAKRVDLESFSSRCWAFRRTHTSADPIQLLCIRLASALTLSRPSRFVPSARLMVGVSYGLCGIFRVTVCFGTRGEEGLPGNRWANRWVQQP